MDSNEKLNKEDIYLAASEEAKRQIDELPETGDEIAAIEAMQIFDPAADWDETHD